MAALTSTAWPAKGVSSPSVTSICSIPWPSRSLALFALGLLVEIGIALRRIWLRRDGCRRWEARSTPQQPHM